jgi:hypothetical protein
MGGGTFGCGSSERGLSAIRSMPACFARSISVAAARVKGMSREAESATFGADFDMGVLHDGPAGSLSPDPQPVTKTPSALSLSRPRWCGRGEVSHLR